MRPTYDVITDGQTFLNPFGLLFTLAMGVLLVILPRRYALVPVLALICYMTLGMRVMVADLNFTMIRVLLLFGWARLIIRREIHSIRFNQIDKAIVWYTIASIVTYVILWDGQYAAFKYKIGKAYDCVGFYFLFRYLIRTTGDVVNLLKASALIVVPLAIEMFFERVTLVNHFAIFQGVHREVWIRDGTPRCQGPFVHPIMAGTFGAGILPWFVGLWWQKGGKFFAVMGALSALIIILVAGSSGPLFACFAGCIALCLWPLRFRMRLVRWAISLTLVGLHLAMNAPIWFLIARVSVYNASTGFHRAYLIDRAVANLGEWWFVGTRTTANWGYYLFDVTNHYIVVGIDGGLLTLALFVMIMVRCFRGIGRIAQVARGDRRNGKELQWLVWALGASFIVHATSFISVSYFDQNLVVWYLLQGMVASLCAVYLDANLREESREPAAQLSGLSGALLAFRRP